MYNNRYYFSKKYDEKFVEIETEVDAMDTNGFKAYVNGTEVLDNNKTVTDLDKAKLIGIPGRVGDVVEVVSTNIPEDDEIVGFESTEPLTEPLNELKIFRFIAGMRNAIGRMAGKVPRRRSEDRKYNDPREEERDVEAFFANFNEESGDINRSVFIESYNVDSVEIGYSAGKVTINLKTPLKISKISLYYSVEERSFLKMADFDLDATDQYEITSADIPRFVRQLRGVINYVGGS